MPAEHSSSSKELASLKLYSIEVLTRAEDALAEKMMKGAKIMKSIKVNQDQDLELPVRMDLQTEANDNFVK